MEDWSALFSALEHLGISAVTDAPMKEHTSFRAGGRAKVLCEPKDEGQVVAAIDLCRSRGIPFFVMGLGSNLLVRDGGLNACVIKVGKAFSGIEQMGNILIAKAGTSLISLSREAIDRGLKGLEWAMGIPGSVGGAVAMNAGAYGSEIKDVVRAVTVFKEGRIERIPVKEEDMSYRKSRFSAPDYVVLSAEFELQKDDGTALVKAKEFLKMRQEKQPLQYPNAGSTFKRPPGHFAGALIEKAGLKGLQVGDAQVSPLHAGFIVNLGNATASDIEALIKQVQERVLLDSGVSLELEVRIVGEGEKPCTS